ncbi:MAG: MurR/RpiR family transcriptional regulator [Amphiplicatus sp.]
MAKTANFAERDVPCLERILQFSDAMSANELKLAEFVLKNAPLLRDYSSQQLASTVKVSQSSVIKFSQKLGYSGFPDLKLAITAELAKGVLPGAGAKEAPQQRIEDQANELHYRKMEYLQAAGDQNSPASLLEAVKALETCSRLVLITVGDALPPARVFADSMTSLGVPTLLASDLPSQQAVTGSLGPNDVMLAVSPAREFGPIVEMARTAKKAGAGVISITAFSLNLLQALADHKLYFRLDDARPEMRGAMIRFALTDVFDTLFLQFAARDAKRRETFMQISKRMTE